MLWFFERDDQSLCVGTGYADDKAEYVLVICGPDGDDCERFGSVADFRARLVDIETRLTAERWTRVGPPVVAPDSLPNRLRTRRRGGSD